MRATSSTLVVIFLTYHCFRRILNQADRTLSFKSSSNSDGSKIQPIQLSFHPNKFLNLTFNLDKLVINKLALSHLV